MTDTDTEHAQRDAYYRIRAARHHLNRLQRDLPGDGSELAPPDDAFWAAQLDGLAAYASELYRETEASTVSAAADKQGD